MSKIYRLFQAHIFHFDQIRPNIVMNSDDFVVFMKNAVTFATTTTTEIEEEDDDEGEIKTNYVHFFQLEDVQHPLKFITKVKTCSSFSTFPNGKSRYFLGNDTSREIQKRIYIISLIIYYMHGNAQNLDFITFSRIFPVSQV